MVLKGELESKFNSLANLDSFKEYFLKTLFDTRSKDAFRCITSIGPHRSELEVSYKEKAIMASLCSTGEQKSLLISIILAVAKSYKNYCNLSPILLLDEVFAHLDNSKKESLSKAAFRFSGHTDYLGHLAGCVPTVMMLATKGLKVVPATVHMSLLDAIASITSSM